MSEADKDETLLEFPCQFPIKVFGKQEGDFEQRVYELIKVHVPELQRAHLSRRDSSGGKYLAVTAHIQAHSQAQLDAIYYDLTDSDAVLMAL